MVLGRRTDLERYGKGNMNTECLLRVRGLRYQVRRWCRSVEIEDGMPDGVSGVINGRKRICQVIEEVEDGKGVEGVTLI